MDQGQIAAITGVPKRCVQRYTKLGLIGTTETIEGNANEGAPHYSPADIHSLKLFCLARKSGYNVRDILTVINAKSRGDVTTLELTREKLKRPSTEKQLASSALHAQKKLKAELDAFITIP